MTTYTTIEAETYFDIYGEYPEGYQTLEEQLNEIETDAGWYSEIDNQQSQFNTEIVFSAWVSKVNPNGVITTRKITKLIIWFKEDKGWSVKPRLMSCYNPHQATYYNNIIEVVESCNDFFWF